MTTPNGTGIINRGQDFANGDQVTAEKLQDIADDAVFNTNAVDDGTIGLDGSGKLFVKDDGIVTSKILNSNVTLPKIANIANDKVLGNVSGGAAAPAELTAAQLVTLLGTDLVDPTSIDNSTESIEFSNGLIVKFGTFSTSNSGVTTQTFSAAFPNHCYGVLTVPNPTTALVASALTSYAREVTASDFVHYVNSSTTMNHFYLAIGR
jgi:hypothetical protein